MRNMNFEKFTQQTIVNRAWIKEGTGKMGLKMYVRRTHESLKDMYGDYQLANAVAISPGNGAFTRFLDKWEAHYDLYIENVLNVGLRRFLERRGYVGDNDAYAPCYIRRRGVYAKRTMVSASRTTSRRNKNRDARIHKGGD